MAQPSTQHTEQVLNATSHQSPQGKTGSKPKLYKNHFGILRYAVGLAISCSTTLKTVAQYET